MIVERDTRVNLRPHNGRTLEQIILGLGAYEKIDDVISKFVGELINFVSEKTIDDDFILPEYFFPKEILSEYGYGTTRTNVNPINEFKKVAFVFDGEILIHNFLEKEEKEIISKQLCDILSSSFGRGSRLFATYEDREKPLFNSDCLDCFANPSYIIWALKQIDDFALSEEAINSTYKTKSISTFKVLPINHPKNNAGVHINSDDLTYSGWYQKSEIVTYEPVIIEKEFEFGDGIKKLNKEKLQKIISNKSCQNYHYDDYSERKIWTDDELNNADWDYDYNNPAHNSHENPWIDVFGPGEEAETAYWNTD